MLIDELYKDIRESGAYLEHAIETAQDGDAVAAGWYGWAGIGNLQGCLLGATSGGFTGLAAAEPPYQAVEATAPDIGPAVRVVGYSVPITQAAITGMLTYEGARIGSHVGKYSGRYAFGSVGAGIGAVIEGSCAGFQQIQDFLEGNND